MKDKRVIKKGWENKMQKTKRKKAAGRALAISLSCLLFATAVSMPVDAKSSKKKGNNDTVSGAVIQSNIYGEVLITENKDGKVDYTFFDNDRQAVRDLLAALNSGADINLDNLLTASAVEIEDITTEDNIPIPNTIVNTGQSAAGVRGNYSPGSVYGPTLSATELAQVRDAVSYFMVTNNTSNMNQEQKVRTAHDFLVLNCAPASKGSQNRADESWGALINRAANAKGYARAMKALCDAMGIGCVVVSANNNSTVKDYMWNVVQIDGAWYIVDVFCDDSTAGYSMYLISDSAYETYGMRWNKNDSIPVSQRNYAS